jgi:hypothetical protein
MLYSRMPRPTHDILGMTFDRLTVIAPAPIEKGPSGRNSFVRWRCRCACGRETIARAASLLQGNTRSCGCLAHEATAARNRKHGYAKRGQHSPEYGPWQHMLRRCFNPTTPQYADYGGRGITVCEQWRRDFPQFLRDMGPRPSARYSLDRINNNGDYTPDNCRWATKKEQAGNRRRSRGSLQQCPACGHTFQGFSIRSRRHRAA